MVGFLIFCVFLGIILAVILAVILAPIIFAGDKVRLKKIDEKIEEFEGKSFPSQEEKEKEKQLLKKELIEIKAKIFDKRAKEEAGDKINLV